MMSVVFLVFLAVVASRRGGRRDRGDERQLRKVALPWFEGKEAGARSRERASRSTEDQQGKHEGIYTSTMAGKARAVTTRTALSLEDRPAVVVAGTCIQMYKAGRPNQSCFLPCTA